MSRHAEVSAPWGGETRIFRLGLKQWEAIEDGCGVGLPVIFNRLAPILQLASIPKDQPVLMLQALMAGAMGSWRLRDVRAILFYGLIGGGASHVEATILVERFFDEAASGQMDNAILAFRIAKAILLGQEDEPVMGESEEAVKTPPKPPKNRSRTAGRASSDSTRPAAG